MVLLLRPHRIQPPSRLPAVQRPLPGIASHKIAGSDELQGLRPYLPFERTEARKIATDNLALLATCR